MNMRKNTRLTPHHREAIWPAYTQNKESVTSLANRFMVSRPTIYRILKAARVGSVLKSMLPEKIKRHQSKELYD